MKPGSVLRNPYVWGFLIGIVTLTAIRPLLRYVPEPPPVIGRLPAFSLVDAEGRPFGSEQLRGQVYIASFFSSGCRSTCPAVQRGMARIQDGLDQMAIRGIRLVSISVDPVHDSPEALRAFARELGAAADRWTFLTGDPERIRALVVDGFDVPLAAAPGTTVEPVDVAHAAQVALVDGSGGVRGYYGTDEMGLDEVYNRARHVLRQQKALLD